MPKRFRMMEKRYCQKEEVQNKVGMCIVHRAEAAGDQYIGNVTSSSAYSITDSSQSFPDNLLYRPTGTMHVAIIQGPGVGY